MSVEVLEMGLPVDVGDWSSFLVTFVDVVGEGPQGVDVVRGGCIWFFECVWYEVVVVLSIVGMSVSWSVSFQC